MGRNSGNNEQRGILRGSLPGEFTRHPLRHGTNIFYQPSEIELGIEFFDFKL